MKEARSKVSEKLAKMHDEVLNAHEESKDLEKVLKDLTNKVHVLKSCWASCIKKQGRATHFPAKLIVNKGCKKKMMIYNVFFLQI